MIRKSIMTFMMCLYLTSTSMAAERYDFDNRHTNIMWFASHFGFSKSMGQFMEYDGHFVLDTDEPTNSSVEVIIDTKSVMTGLDGFDRHLRGGDFFDSENFPKAIFKSTKVTLINEQQATVEGRLTLKGVSKPMTLNVTLNKMGVNPFNQKYTAGFTAEGSLLRSDYGITYALPGVSDEVNILIEAEGLRRQNDSTQE